MSDKPPARTTLSRSSVVSSCTDTSPSGPVTLGLVAKAAQVSPSTVSRILNGTARVSADKRKAVDEAIARLEFRPNPVARGLAGGKTLSVGVLTQSIDSPYYGEGLRGIEGVLNAAGYIPIFVCGHWNLPDEKRCLEVLLSRRVDGMIVFAGQLDNDSLLQVSQHIPLVLHGRQLNAPGVISLNFDNFEGARMATRHLIELGHRRIAHISGDFNHGDALERFEGYRKALEEKGIPYDPTLVVAGQYHEASGLMAANHLIENNLMFTAIFAANDQMALGAMLGLYRKRFRVPDDVSVVGFDDLAGSLYSIPPLTTVRQPVFDLGKCAAECMLSLLNHQTPTVSLPLAQLVVRESTKVFRM